MLKPFIYSIVFNLVILYFYTLWIAKPIHDIAEMVAKNICNANHLSCEFNPKH